MIGMNIHHPGPLVPKRTMYLQRIRNPKAACHIEQGVGLLLDLEKVEVGHCSRQVPWCIHLLESYRTPIHKVPVFPDGESGRGMGIARLNRSFVQPVSSHVVTELNIDATPFMLQQCSKKGFVYYIGIWISSPKQLCRERHFTNFKITAGADECS